MAFGGEVEHCAGLVLGQQSADEFGVTDVALNKNMPRIALQAGQGFGVTCVGEFVEVDDGLLTG